MICGRSYHTSDALFTQGRFDSRRTIRINKVGVNNLRDLQDDKTEDREMIDENKT